MVFAPTANGIAAEADPLTTEIPFTVTVALGSAAVGVKAILLVPLATATVYAVVAGTNNGDRTPALTVRLARLSFVDNAVEALVTVTVYVFVVTPS